MICCLECSTPLLLRTRPLPPDRKVSSVTVSNISCTACGAVYEMSVVIVKSSELPADMLEARRNVNR